VLKVLLGMGLVVAAKVGAKAALVLLLKHAFAAVPLRVRCLWQPPTVGATLRHAGKQAPAAAQQEARQAREQQQREQLMHKLQEAAAAAAAAAAGGHKGADGSDAGTAKDAGGSKQLRSSGGLVGDSAGRAPASSSGGADSVWGLRHGFDGTPNDVMATARWGSYFAVGYVIVLWNYVWPPLAAAAALPHSSSLS
jgi:hypothetical protein